MPQNTLISIPQIHYFKHNLWIIKPPDLLGGKNIEVSGNIEEIEKILIKHNKNSGFLLLTIFAHLSVMICAALPPFTVGLIHTVAISKNSNFIHNIK